MPTATFSNHCLRYWDLADHIRIEDAIALWCGVEPAELAKLNFETQCIDPDPDSLPLKSRNFRTNRLVLESSSFNFFNKCA